MQGFCDHSTTMEVFRSVLSTMGCPEEKAKGAYIPTKIDYPPHDRIILIGDAGGFPSRLTSEGLYFAFLTAKSAVEAISSGRPFAEVNRQLFKNKNKEVRYARFFYSRTGLSRLRFLCRRFPATVQWCYYRMTNQ